MNITLKNMHGATQNMYVRRYNGDAYIIANITGKNHIPSSVKIKRIMVSINIGVFII